MIFKNILLKRLKSEQDKRQKRVTELLLQGKVKETKSDTDWLQIAAQIISRHENNLKAYWAFGIAVFCFIIIGIAFTVHVPATNALIEIMADGLTISFSEHWQSENNITADYFYLDKVNKISGNLDPGLFNSANPTSFEFKGKASVIKNIEINKEAVLDLFYTRNDLYFYLKNSDFKADLSVRKGNINFANKYTTIDILPGKPRANYKFKSMNTQNKYDYIRLDMGNINDFLLKNFKINKLSFMVEKIPGSGKFESTLIKGNLFMYDVAKNIELFEKDNVVVEFDDCRQTKVFLKNNKITIQVSGEVSQLMGGYGDFSKNYKPTYLEYYYNNQPLAILWSAMVFLFGLLWSIKNTIFRK